MGLLALASPTTVVGLCGAGSAAPTRCRAGPGCDPAAKRDGAAQQAVGQRGGVDATEDAGSLLLSLGTFFLLLQHARLDSSMLCHVRRNHATPSLLFVVRVNPRTSGNGGLSHGLETQLQTLAGKKRNTRRRKNHWL
jgi:hypothetical protein